jgi:two-component system, sensor histidine kinase and response regulator
VDSTPGEGSAFEVTLDSAPRPDPPDHPEPVPPAGEPVAGDAGSGHVLVADDNPVNRKLAVAMLQRIGYPADTVGNGAEAVRAVSSRPDDAVLMDCRMPEVDGYQATAEIRRREGSSRHTPVIAMTANAMEGDREKGLQAGMDDYLSKPTDIEDLRQALHRWIGADTPAPRR